MASWPPWHDGSPIPLTLRERLEKEGKTKEDSTSGDTIEAEAKEEERDDYSEKTGRGDNV